MASIIFAFALALLAVLTSAFPVYDVEEGDVLEVNPNRGTSFTSVSRLDSSRAIQCYADYGDQGSGAGTCNILEVDGVELRERNAAPFVFNENETIEIRVQTFSSSKAVVCYSDKGFSLKLICRLLDVTTDSLSASQAFIVDPDADEVSHLGLASLSEDLGVLCWADTGPTDNQKDRPGVCNLLSLDGGAIEVGGRFDFDTERSTSDISVGAFSDESAMLCWSAEGTGFCAALSLEGGVEGGLSMGAKKEFFQSSREDFQGIVVVSFTQTQGVVCYADGDQTANQVGCKVLLLDGSTLTVGSQEIVSDQPAEWLTATDLTSEAALVCYATPTTGNGGVGPSEGTASCNVVGITMDNTTVGAGPSNEVNDRPTQYMVLASLDMESGVLCFSDGGAGEGKCKALRMAPTTTSTTETTTSTSSLTSDTTTSPHTTTATTTTTETSTTSFHTTTETKTTTSPHTTTATATQNRQPQEDSGSTSPAMLGAIAASGVALSLSLQ